MNNFKPGDSVTLDDDPRDFTYVMPVNGRHLLKSRDGYLSVDKGVSWVKRADTGYEQGEEVESYSGGAFKRATYLTEGLGCHWVVPVTARDYAYRVDAGDVRKKPEELKEVRLSYDGGGERGIWMTATEFKVALDLMSAIAAHGADVRGMPVTNSET